VAGFLDDVGATHVVVDELDPQTQRFLLPAQRAQPRRFDQAARDESGKASATLFELRR
jgi:hypothetical protein